MATILDFGLAFIAGDFVQNVAVKTAGAIMRAFS
jgi:hypothetical protein